MTAGTVSPAWSLDRLLSSLGKGGWGSELGGAHNAGLQRVLTALKDLLPWDSAEGRLTRNQVADAASMTPRWAGRCLHVLEQLGLVVWHRGWLDKGRPRAGWIRVDKKRLAELVRGVRGYLEPRRAKRRTETADRIATTLKRITIPPQKRQTPLSRRGELSSTLSTRSTSRRRGDFKTVIPPQQMPPDPFAQELCPGCRRTWQVHDHFQLISNGTRCQTTRPAYV